MSPKWQPELLLGSLTNECQWPCPCEVIWQLKTWKTFTTAAVYKWPPHRSSQLERVSQELAHHHHQHLSYCECCKQSTGTCRDGFCKLEGWQQQDGWVGWAGPSYVWEGTLLLRQLPSANPYGTILYSSLTALPLSQPSTLDFKMNEDKGCLSIVVWPPCGQHLCTLFSWFPTTDWPGPIPSAVLHHPRWSQELITFTKFQLGLLNNTIIFYDYCVYHTYAWAYMHNLASLQPSPHL